MTCFVVNFSTFLVGASVDNRGLLDRPPPALGDGGVGAVQLGGGGGAKV